MKDITLVVALVCLLTDPTYGYTSCDSPWKHNSGYCHLFHLESNLNWYNSRSECQKDGADLAMILDGEMHRFVNGFLGTENRFWIGLKEKKSGGFEWVNPQEQIKYTAWGEINLSRIYFSCGFISGNLESNWNIARCNWDKRNYFCQKKAYTSAHIIPPYDATMDEGQAIGTKVSFTHRITNPDTPQNQMTYGLSGPDAVKFAIDSSGVITLTEVLDYDAGQTTFSITLEVNDTMPLTASQVLTLTLNLNDINDNSPICTPNVIYANVTEKEKAKKIIATLSCPDADGSSPNNNVTLSITNGPAEFIMSGNDVITTSTATDYEKEKSYKIVLHAVDGGIPSNTATATVFVEILPVNEDKPAWGTSTPSGTTFSIDETSSLGTSVVTVTATDADDGSDGEVTYGITGNIDFIIGKNTGIIRNAKRLDFEQMPTYTLTVTATDSGTTPKTSTMTLTINVRNVNEWTPTCPEYYVPVNIVEPANIGDEVTTLVCTNKDTADVLTATIATGDETVFSLDNTTQKLTLLSNLDYETKTDYALTIEIKDSVQPIRTATVTVTVLVIPVNEYSPKFENSKHTLSPLSESTAIGTSIYKVVATDRDKGSDGDITYSIDSGNIPAGSFVIGSQSGDVIVSSVLDYDSTPNNYKLTIKAVDGGGKTGTMVLEIPLEDENDNVLDCEAAEINLNVNENVPTSTEFTTAVHATDKDSGDNSNISYSIVGGDSATTFSIDSTSGVISTKGSIDYEFKSSYLLFVQASDAGTPVHSVTCMAIITVNDLNDNTPVFTRDDVTTSVSEKVSIGTSVIKMVATDDDSTDDKNNDVKYSLNSASFQINQDTGEITTKAQLDRESLARHDLTVTAYDRAGGSGSLTGTSTVTVNLIDVNDNSPIITDSSYDVSISEDLKPGNVVATIRATDADEGDNARLSFSIINGATHNDLVIETNSGVIQIANRLDPETTDKYFLKILVTDNGKPSLSATVTCSVTILDVNDNIPTFSKSSYNFSITENVPFKSSAGFLVASDADIGVNKDLSFEIVTFWLGNSSHFLLNPTTGEITSNSYIDRETIDVYQLWCRVVDHGTPKLSSYVNVTIHVNDVNDNHPIFTSTMYSGKVIENSAVDTTVITLTVTDLDVGVNGDISLHINTTSTEGYNANTFLAVNSTTGAITVRTNIDREVQSLFEFQVIAVDAGSSQHSSSTSVSIDVADVNEYSPTFANSEHTLSPLSESTAIGTSIYKIIATDRDKGSDGDITYSIDSGNIPAGSFVIESQSGDVIVSSVLDYDSSPNNYKLTIKAEDGGGKTGTMVLEIPLEDENDNAPDCDAAEINLNVNENVPISTQFTTSVHATDKDSGDNSNISYSIVGGDSAATFSIDSTSGVISTKRSIDYEFKSSYLLIVQASDAGTPVHSVTCMAIITVNDLNDNTPVFTPDDVTTSVSEKVSIGTTVIKMVATDDDSTDDKNNDVKYSLNSASFQINQDTGEITTKANLDRESLASHNLTVTAYDRAGGSGSLTGTSTVTVNLIDVNDNSPIITDSSYDVSISEDLKPGKVVATIRVTDADEGDNARLSFSIINGATHNDLVIETNSGVIQVANRLDRETTDKYFLKILVTDNGKPSLSATVTCSVTILDVNDNIPTFSKSSYNFSITENVPFKSSAGFLVASDADIGVNKDLSFEIATFWVGNSSHFLLNPTTGEITSNSYIDRETIDVYQLWCRVVDHGTPKLSSDVNVTIHVNDVNDNHPIFTSTMYSGNVIENSAVDTTVITLTVTDLDVGVNGDISLYINTTSTEGYNANTFLAVNSTTGAITVRTNIDREVQSLFEFQVIAVDAGSPQHTSSTSVSIDVTDVNDNAPEFNPTYYNVEIAYIGSCDNDNTITTVTATDEDIGRNAQLKFYLIDNTYKHIFYINSAGVFSILDRVEPNFRYVIGVGVIDNGITPKVASIRATIRIDTFDPNKAVTTFRLKISKQTFQRRQAFFMNQLETLFRVKHPEARVKLWCVEDGSGTTSRRRLLQSSDESTVYVYTVADNTTDDNANVDQTKKILSSTEMVTLMTMDGSPNSAIRGPAWDYFSIEAVREYHVTPPPWERTTAGIATLVVISVCFVLIIVVIIICWFKRNKRHRKSNEVDRVGQRNGRSQQRQRDVFGIPTRSMYLSQT